MESDEDKDFIFTVKSESIVKYLEIGQVFREFGINGPSVRMKIDTMPSLNVIDKYSYKIKDNPKLKALREVMPKNIIQFKVHQRINPSFFNSNTIFF